MICACLTYNISNFTSNSRLEEEKPEDEAHVYDRTTDDVASHYYTSLQGVAQGARAGGADQEKTGYANVAGSSGGAGDGPQYINAGAVVEGGQRADSTYKIK